MVVRGTEFQALLGDVREWPHSRLAKFLSEFVGTYFLVLTVGCNVLTASVGGALSVGGMLMVMVYSLQAVSGAHFNPAVTAAVWGSARSLLSLQDASYYVVAQLLGGVAAGLSYHAIDGGSFVFAPVGAHSMRAAMSVEVAYSAALCYIVLNVATTRKQEGNHYFGLAIGFTVVAATIAIGDISGCCLNPAISSGATIAAALGQGMSAINHLNALCYFFAPLVGAVFSCVAFFIVQREDEYFM